METQEQVDYLCNQFSEAVVRKSENDLFSTVEIRIEFLETVLRFLKKDDRLQYDFLESITARNVSSEFVVYYQLLSTSLFHRINIKTIVDQYKRSLPTVTSIWKGAYYLELEVADLFGVFFLKHPSLKDHRQLPRLFLPENWVGFPLCKDYIYPEDFAGIDHRRPPLRREHLRT